MGGGGAISHLGRDTDTGALTSTNDQSSCYSRTGAADGIGGTRCTVLSILPTSFTDLVLSADGEFLYVTGRQSTEDLVVVLDRNPATGALEVLATGVPCISRTGVTAGCHDDSRWAVTGGISLIDPSGTNLYVTHRNVDQILIATRAASGEVTPVAGAAGCIDDDGNGTTCTDAVALDGVDEIVISADGNHLYAAAGTSDAIAIFDRDTGTGHLTQKAGTAGCISETGTGGACQDGEFLDPVSAVTLALGDTHAYVASNGATNQIDLYDRDPVTGALTRRGTMASCISDDGSGGQCQTAVAFGSPSKLILAADGRPATSRTNRQVRRSGDRPRPDDGGDQPEGRHRGVRDRRRRRRLCEVGVPFNELEDVVVSPDDENVYVASEEADAVAVFDRFTCEEHEFSDVPPWVTDAVDWAFCGTYMTGYDDGTFRPDLPITRAQVARLLYRVAGSPDVTGLPHHGFSDVPGWVNDAVTWLADNDYMTGYPDNTFRPNIPISRGQVTRATYRVQGSPGGAPPNGYPDVPNWLDPAADWATWGPGRQRPQPTPHDRLPPTAPSAPTTTSPALRPPDSPAAPTPHPAPAECATGGS